MKPLPSAPLTPEDDAIWELLARSLAFRTGMQTFWDWAEMSDRRDAALMLVAVRHPMLAALQNPEFPRYRIDIRQGTGHSVAHLKMYVTRDEGIT
jgi:hypothetical protein